MGLITIGGVLPVTVKYAFAEKLLPLLPPHKTVNKYVLCCGEPIENEKDEMVVPGATVPLLTVKLKLNVNGIAVTPVRPPVDPAEHGVDIVALTIVPTGPDDGLRVTDCMEAAAFVAEFVIGAGGAAAELR